MSTQTAADLTDLQRNWEALAQDDPLWAVLTDDCRRGRQWDAGAFLGSGESEIATMWERLIQHVEPDTRLPALDFGCGAGRLTQALARRMNGCVGLDIAPTMIDTAKRLNRNPGAKFVLNDSDRLPFDDDTFGLVYSSIVLQHMRPMYARRYIIEFARVTAPDGVIVFGIPERFLPFRGSARVRAGVVRWRSAAALGTRVRQRRLHIEREVAAGSMEMHGIPEQEIRELVDSIGARLVDVASINAAERDFNGDLRYDVPPPRHGWISKQYVLRV